ncbi:hypothetical protein Tco_0861263 [Tanacetum coccineum]|uniref:Uncharacterized protein n=1 Tax=Tanacetum coccineum TaxID=301880 RepID=A0ABQ5BKN7_9ASTR
MSSPPAPIITETIPSAGGARGFPIPTPFHDDPYMLIEEPQPLSPRSTPLSLDYTPPTPHTDEESEPSKTSETSATSPHSTTSPSDLTSPPSP